MSNDPRISLHLIVGDGLFCSVEVDWVDEDCVDEIGTLEMLIPVLSAQYIGQVIKSFASVFQSVNGQSELTAEQVAVFQFY